MNRRWLGIIGSGIVVGLVLVAVISFLWFALPMTGFGSRPVNLFAGQYKSNGERIYYTATSNSGQPVTAQMTGMHRMGGMMACVTCHGPDGRGGPVTMMMGTFEAPDIRYHILTEAEHSDTGEEHEEHPPYTDTTLKQAITQGIDPAGEPLVWPMPRWQMSEQDLNDLIAYLKQLG